MFIRHDPHSLVHDLQIVVGAHTPNQAINRDQGFGRCKEVPKSAGQGSAIFPVMKGTNLTLVWSSLNTMPYHASPAAGAEGSSRYRTRRSSGVADRNDVVLAQSILYRFVRASRIALELCSITTVQLLITATFLVTARWRYTIAAANISHTDPPPTSGGTPTPALVPSKAYPRSP